MILVALHWIRSRGVAGTRLTLPKYENSISYEVESAPYKQKVVDKIPPPSNKQGKRLRADCTRAKPGRVVR